MIIDETYDKYMDVAYHWSENKNVNRGVRIYAVRNEYYGDKQFYVLGIGTSNFLEVNGYNKSKEDWIEKAEEKGGLDYDPRRILKTLCGSNWVSIDDLAELSNLLKEAGAKEVYLHPSFWMDDCPLEHPVTDEWLIVIPKETKE